MTKLPRTLVDLHISALTSNFSKRRKKKRVIGRKGGRQNVRERERERGGMRARRQKRGRKTMIETSLLHCPEIKQLFHNSFGQDKSNEVEKKN